MGSSRLLVVYEEYAPYATTVIELVPGKMEVLTADFTLLREPETVIRATKEALRRMSPAVKRIHTFGLHVPRELIAKTQEKLGPAVAVPRYSESHSSHLPGSAKKSWGAPNTRSTPEVIVRSNIPTKPMS